MKKYDKNTCRPPRAAEFLLKRMIDGRISNPALGDLEEQFRAMAAERGLFFSRLHYWLQIYPVFINMILEILIGGGIMLNSYFKSAVRYILRKKFFSFINILGLDVGMACFILISIWVQDELSFDEFHENKDRLYLLSITHPNDIVDRNVPYALASVLAGEFPEISDYTRIYKLSALKTCSFRYQPDDGPPAMFYEDSVNLVDAGFFSMFSFPFVDGSPETALRDRNALVINEKIAHKYFGTENPLGKKLTLNNRSDLIVTGVVRVPENSALRFDFMALLEPGLSDDWNWRDPSFLLLDEKASVDGFRAKISGSLNEHFPHRLPGAFKVDILPITELHLNFGRKIYVYLFSLIAIFILFIACVNYMNLATAGSAKRAREVGLRKVVGAGRSQLAFQFMGESILLSALAFLLSLPVVKLSLPVLNNLTGKHLSLFPFQNAYMVPLLFGLILFVGIVSGSYPALYLSSGKPIDRLRSITGYRANRSLFRVISVVGQFAISVLLIACTMVVFKQLNFVRNRPLGFDTDYVLKIPMNDGLRRSYESFKNRLLQNPNVSAVSASQAIPYDEDYKTSGLEWNTKDSGMVPMVRYSIVDYDYIELYEMEVLDGRSFSMRFSGDRENFIINQTAAEYMNMKSPVGKRLKFWGREGRIIGVVKDFHHVSLHNEIMPHVFTINPRFHRGLKYISVKVNSTGLSDTIKSIQAAASTAAPDFPFEYAFLDQGIGNLYRAEQDLGKIFSYFAFLAIFISCLGIFGLSAFTAQQRIKEIGIRKVLGCSVSGIIIMLSKKFSLWVLLSNLIAWPIGYYVMSKWLRNFAYRTDFKLTVFILAGVLSLIIAALPVGYQALKAAVADPVESLRYE